MKLCLVCRPYKHIYEIFQPPSHDGKVTKMNVPVWMMNNAYTYRHTYVHTNMQTHIHTYMKKLCVCVYPI